MTESQIRDSYRRITLAAEQTHAVMRRYQFALPLSPGFAKQITMKTAVGSSLLQRPIEFRLLMSVSRQACSGFCSNKIRTELKALQMLRSHYR
jgi:hypothetical protein